MDQSSPACSAPGKLGTRTANCTASRSSNAPSFPPCRTRKPSTKYYKQDPSFNLSKMDPGHVNLQEEGNQWTSGNHEQASAHFRKNVLSYCAPTCAEDDWLASAGSLDWDKEAARNETPKKSTCASRGITGALLCSYWRKAASAPCKFFKGSHVDCDRNQAGCE